MRICVIGAGILGLTTVYELCCRGHDVTIVDREHAFAGASHRSFAWINANNKSPASYHRINALGVEEHQRLQDRFPSDREWVHMSGNILADFSASYAETYAKRIETADENDYPVQRISRDELKALEPEVEWPDNVEGALFFPEEGYLDNDILAEEIIASLETRGVGIDRAEAERIDSCESSATVVFTDGREAQFDRVVIAAGAGSRELGATSGWEIPVADLSTPSPRTHSLLGLTKPKNIGLRRVIISDRINVRPRHDGRMWVQVPGIEVRVEEGESRKLLSEVGLVMEAELERLFGKEVPMEKVIFSGRSFPEDGMSIVGHVDEWRKVYCAITHSGMTLAALFARLTADELEGAESELLADFRPSRFAGEVIQPADDNFIGKQ
ncbi:NAD(P)/FAD-dependent oxidoreductase [Arthrobacter castelli]|uniref:NAD(P)/FAD-dependent oxidoreductase n=1 Tax=Arthrobacter castelli TaxID=271431 RepID=UPI00040A8A64|nr:FAD-binding oxidoreductase [Arthrobacter castelli]